MCNNNSVFVYKCLDLYNLIMSKYEKTVHILIEWDFNFHVRMQFILDWCNLFSYVLVLYIFLL